MNTTVTIRMPEEEKKALTEFAKFQGMCFSDWARKTLCEAFEDCMDYKIGLLALEEYEDNPVSYSVTETAEILGDLEALGDA